MNEMIARYDGRRILLGEEIHEVVGKVLDRGVVKLRSLDGVAHEISDDDFRRFVSLGCVTAESAGSGDRMLSEAERIEQSFRQKVVVRALDLAEDGVSWADRVAALRDQMRDDPVYISRQRPFPGARTIQSWIKRWRRSGTSGLVPQTSRCGNRSRRHDDDFENIVLDVLEEHYLPHDRHTVESIVAIAQSIYLEKCSREGRDPAAHGRKVVRQIIESLPHHDVVKSRLGAKDAQKQLLRATRLQKVEAPLDRVELDCTTADMHCVGEDGAPVGRVTVCAAIDAATGVVLGMSLVLGPPTSALVAATIKEIMQPKPATFFDKYMIEHRFQAFGRPKLIVVDQGSENAGDIITSIIKYGGIEFSKNLPGHPEKKPFIERFFREMSAFLQTIEGATKSTMIKSNDRSKRALAEARFTVDQLETMLQKWRYDSYAQRPRRRVQSALRSKEAPAICWERLARTCFLPDPPTPAELRNMFMLRTAVKTLHRYGIELHGVAYASDELAQLRDRIGDSQKIEVRYDPFDIREICVIDPLTKYAFPVACKDPDLPAISFADARAIRKATASSKDQEIKARVTAVNIGAGKMFEKGRAATTKLQKSRMEEIKKRKQREIVDRARMPTLAAQGASKEIVPPVRVLKTPRPSAPAPTAPRTT